MYNRPTATKQEKQVQNNRKQVKGEGAYCKGGGEVLHSFNVAHCPEEVDVLVLDVLPVTLHHSTQLLPHRFWAEEEENEGEKKKKKIQPINQS